MMRQREDRKFADMLNRIRVHVRGQKLNDEDLETLLTVSDQHAPEDILHIFPNKQGS